jgi:DNA gyrase/topoisomerase IV subunit B
MSKDKPNITQAELSVSELHSGSKFEAGNNIARVGLNGVGSAVTNFTSSIYIILSKITEFNYDRSIPPVKELWEKAGPRSKKDLFYIIVFEEGIKVYEGAGKLKDLEKMIFKGIKNYVSIPEGQSTIVFFKPDPKIWDNCTPEIPMTNLQYFLLIQEKFYKRKVNVVVDGVNIRSTFNPYKFELVRTVTPKDTSANKQVGLYITFEADPGLGNAQVYGSVNGLDVSEGMHINLGKNLYKAALKSYFGMKHDYLLNGLKMVVIILANEVQYNSQTKENLKQITKVKPADFEDVLKDFQKIFKKNEDYWEPHIEKLNLLAESFKSISAMDKAQKIMDDASGRGIYKAKGDMIEGFADATAGAGDRWNCEAFLVEGLSPGGSLKGARKSTKYTAVIPMRGKIKNVKDSTADQAMDNKELFTIFKLVGLGIDINNVTKGCKTPEEAYEKIKQNSRYGKIIIATDADEDGLAIQNGLLYAISKFARFMLDFGLVYIAESPVFIQNGKYFYPSDPRVPGTQFPIGLDTNKKYMHIKGLGSLDPEDVYNAFYNPATRRLFRVTTDGIDFSMKLVEDIDFRKKLLFDKGILSNPYNFTDL